MHSRDAPRGAPCFWAGIVESGSMLFAQLASCFAIGSGATVGRRTIECADVNEVWRVEDVPLYGGVWQRAY